MLVCVRLTPKAAMDRLDSVVRGPDGDWVLKARVRAVPEDGKANAALVILVAHALGVPKSAVSLAGGSRSRDKRLRIDAGEAAIHAVLDALAASDPAAGR